MNILGRILGVLCQAIGLAPMAAAQSNSTNGFDLNEVWYVVIGAVIGFVASIGTVIVERILDRRGKLKTILSTLAAIEGLLSHHLALPIRQDRTI